MFYKIRLEDLRPKIANKILKELEGKNINKVEICVKAYEKNKLGIRIPFNDIEYRNGYFLFLYEGKEVPKFMEKCIYKEGIYFYSPKLVGYDMMNYLESITDILDKYTFTKVDNNNYEFNCDENDKLKWKYIFSKLGKKMDKEDVSIYDNHFWFIEGLN